MLSDVTPFFSGFGGASQSPAIAQAFAHAALDPAGACKQPAAGVVDLAVSLTGPASLTPGTPASSWLRVANPDVVARTAPTVTVTLPPGVTATGTPPVGCTFSSANTIVTCQLPDRSVARSSNLTIQLVAAGGAGGNAQPSVPAQTGEVNTANNNAALAIAIGAAPPSPTAVPTLDVWALFALGGLLPLVAARHRRQN